MKEGQIAGERHRRLREHFPQMVPALHRKDVGEQPAAGLVLIGRREAANAGGIVDALGDVVGDLVQRDATILATGRDGDRARPGGEGLRAQREVGNVLGEVGGVARRALDIGYGSLGGGAGPEQVDRNAAGVQARIGERDPADDLAGGRIAHGVRRGIEAFERDIVVGPDVRPVPAMLEIAFDLEPARPGEAEAGGEIERARPRRRVRRLPEVEIDPAHRKCGRVRVGQDLLDRRVQKGIAAEDGEAVEAARVELLGLVVVVARKRQAALGVERERRRDVELRVPEIAAGGDVGGKVAEHLGAVAADLDEPRLRRPARIGNERPAGRELLERQGPAQDQAARRRSRRPQIVPEDQLPGNGRIAEEAGAAPAPVPIADALDAAHLEIGGACHDPPAPFREGLAGGDAGLVGRGVSLVGDAGLRGRLDPGEARVEHEVHDAGHGIGPIGGRSAAGHDVDTLHQLLRKQVDVGRTVAGRGRRPAAVDEHQRALHPQIAKVEIASGLRPHRPREGARGTRRPAERRQLVERLADQAGLALGQVLGRHDRYRRRRLRSVADRPRSGDDDIGTTGGDRPRIPLRILRQRLSRRIRCGLRICGNRHQRCRARGRKQYRPDH